MPPGPVQSLPRKRRASGIHGVASASRGPPCCGMALRDCVPHFATGAALVRALAHRHFGLLSVVAVPPFGKFSPGPNAPTDLGGPTFTLRMNVDCGWRLEFAAAI